MGDTVTIDPHLKPHLRRHLKKLPRDQGVHEYFLLRGKCAERIRWRQVTVRIHIAAQ